MKNLSLVKNCLTGNNKDVLVSFVFLLVIFSFLVQSIYIIFQLPLFADGTFHATIIREIYTKGGIIDYSPVGWMGSPILTDVGLKPVIPHLPGFYVLNAILTNFTRDVEISIVVTNILTIILLISILYVFWRKLFNTDIALYSVIFLTATPMFLWLISHRLIEPLLYFASAVLIYHYFIHYHKRPSKLNFFLLTLLLAAVFWTKISGIALIFALLIDFFIKNGVKRTLILLFCTALILSPVLLYEMQTKGIIDNSFRNIPFADKIFHPWWEWDKPAWDVQLTSDADWNNTIKQLDEYWRRTAPAPQKYFIKADIPMFLQYFSILPVSTNASVHEFSPSAKNPGVTGLFTLIFILGLLFALLKKQYRRKTFFLCLLFLSLVSLVLYSTGTIGPFRHLFFISILFSIFFRFGITTLLLVSKNKLCRILIVSTVVIILQIVTFSETIHVLGYKNTFYGAVIKKGGITELRDVSRFIEVPEDENIFTPSPEVAYYISRPIVWDYRIFFVPKEKVPIYFEYFNASYLMIPHYMLRESINSEPNIKENWIKHVYNAIPTDSGFYELLKDGKYFQKVKDYKGFSVYRFNSNYSSN